MNLYDKVPFVHKDAFVAPNASIIGDVHVGSSSSIWYGCVIRGMFLFELNIAVISCVLVDFDCYQTIGG